MAYLQPTEYESYGLPPDTTDDWIAAASSVIEGYCRRETLNPQQYTERLRAVEGSPTVRLTYLPLVSVAPASSPLVSVQGRYARPRRGELGVTGLTSVAYAFALPGAWVELDGSSIDVVEDTGELVLPYNVLGLPYSELSVTYTAGLAVIPPAVKVACAQIVKNAQATPGANVRSSRMDTLWMQYFSGSLLDDQVRALLRPYVANRLG